MFNIDYFHSDMVKKSDDKREQFTQPLLVNVKLPLIKENFHH